MPAFSPQEVQQNPATSSQGKAFRRIASFAIGSLRNNRGKFAVYCGLTALEISLFLVAPKVSALLINSLTQHDGKHFRVCVLILIGLTFCAIVVGLVRALFRIAMDESIGANIRRAAFRSILCRQLMYIEQFPQGDIVSRVLNDSGGLQDLATGVLAQIFFDTLSLVVLAALLLRMQFSLGLIVVLVAPAPVLFSHLFGKQISEAARRVRVKFAEIMVTAQSWLADPLALKLFVLEGQAASVFSKDNDTLRDHSVTANSIGTWVSTGGSLLFAIPSLMIFAYGGTKVFAGSLSIGDLFAFSAFAGYFNAPAQRLVQAISVTIPTRIPMLERVLELAGPAEDTTRNQFADRKTASVEAISAENVVFSLESGFHVSIPLFEARRGEIVGITGPNGSGKTTFLKILAGLYPPDGGTVKSTQASQPSTGKNDRRLFAAFPQKQTVYPGTIGENVRLFSETDGDHDWSEISRKFPLLEWIELLPGGWNTRIDGGVVARMSGGQLQRIGLARVLCANAAINLFDEPTNALDAELLPHLDRSLEQLASDRIVIIVTHSAEMLSRCHRIYRMNKTGDNGMSWKLTPFKQNNAASSAYETCALGS